ncbi:MAG: NUDIX domain-containing protein [Bacteroidia bacterium]
MKKEYPRIDVGVDAVVFAYNPDAVSVLLIKRKKDPYKGKWAIPGGFMEVDESPEDAVCRELKEETGIELNKLEQFHTFGDPDRDPRKRVISIAYYGLVKAGTYSARAGDDAAEAKWFNCKELPDLAFDHKQILDMAISCLRNKVKYEPIGFELLGKQFHFSELHRLYEVILDKAIDQEEFKRKLLSLGIITECKRKDQNTIPPVKNLYCFGKINYKKFKSQGIA